MEEILMGGLGMFLFKQGSRNSINNKRREENFAAHFLQTLSVRLPHQDTVSDVLCQLDPDYLDKIKMDWVSHLFEQKCLRPFRLLDQYYLIAVDATGLVRFSHRHCEHCLTRKTKDSITYFHYVLEAKLITASGLCFSVATEWVENPSGEFDKQDCERKAFKRLAAKIKEHFPRLPVCILADGLYPYDGAFSICEANDWKYIFVLPDNSLKTVHEELGITKLRKPVKESYTVKDGWPIAGQYRYQEAIPYQKHSLNWFQSLETRIEDKAAEKRRQKESLHSRFEYVTNITPTKTNIESLSIAGRLRWKIENEGFNTQKNGDYELQHKYFRKSYIGLKNDYTLLQIAHMINQFLERDKTVTQELKSHSKETIRNIWSNLIAYMLMIKPKIIHPPEMQKLSWKNINIPPHPL
jgi:hypothetical protein